METIDKQIGEYLQGQLLLQNIVLFSQPNFNRKFYKALSSQSNLEISVLAITHYENDAEQHNQNFESKESLQKQYEILKECNNRNILKQAEIYQTELFTIITFESFEYQAYCLNNIIARNPAIEFLIVDFSLQILQCMSLIHTKKYLFYQLSLDNIFVDAKGIVKLYKVNTQYLVNIQSTVDHQNIILNPPETLNSLNQEPEKYFENKSTNIWSFGICVCQMAGMNEKEIMDLYQKDSSVGWIGNELNDILKRILKPLPNQRPNIDDLIKQFREIQNKLQNEQTVLKMWNFAISDDYSDQQLSFQMIQMACKIDSSLFEHFVSGILKKIELDQFSETIKFLNKILESSILDVLYSLNQELKQQIQNYFFDFIQECKQKQPQNLEWVYILSRFQFQLKEFNDSYQNLNYLFSQDFQKQTPKVYLDLGQVCNSLQKYDESMQYLTSYAQIFPQDYFSLIYQGICQYQKGNINESITLLKKSINQNIYHNNSEPYFHLGTIYQKVDQSKAEKYFQKSVEEDSNNNQSIIEIALIQKEQHKIKEAKCTLKKVINVINVELNINQLIQIAPIYFEFKYLKTSLKCYQKVIKIDSKSIEGLKGAIKCCIQLNYYYEGLGYYERLILLTPNDLDCIFGYASLLTKQGFHEEAIKILKQQQNNSKILLQIGEIYFLSKQYEKSIHSFQQYVEQEPQSCIGLQNLAKVYEAQEKQQEAVNAYKQCLDIDPKNTISLRNLGINCYKNSDYDSAKQYFERINQNDILKDQSIYYLISIYMKCGDLEKAYTCLEAVVQDSKTNYFETGAIFYKMKMIDEAIFCYKKDLEINPQNDLNFLNLGNAYKKIQQYEESLKNYQKCLEINPKNSTCYMGMGNSYKMLNRFQDALDCFQKCINLDPEDYDCYYNMGILFQSNNDIPNSIKAFESCFKLNPHDKECANCLANIYEDKKEYHKAIFYYDAILKLDQYDESTLYSLGNCYSLIGEYDSALKYFHQSISIDPKYAPSLMYLGETYLQLQEYENSIKFLLESLQIDPNNEECYDYLAQAYSKSQQQKEAIQTYLKLIELKPSKQAYINLANLYSRCSRLEDAILCYEKYNQFNPSDYLYYFNIGILFVKQGRYEIAIENLLKSFQLNKKFIDIECLHVLSKACFLNCQFLFPKKIFLQLVNHDQRYQPFYNNILAEIYLLTSNYELALQQLKLNLNSENRNCKPKAQILTLQTLLEQGKIEECLNALKKFQNLPMNDSFLIIGNAYYQKQNFINAHQYYCLANDKRRSNLYEMNKRICLKQEQIRKNNMKFIL